MYSIYITLYCLKEKLFFQPKEFSIKIIKPEKCNAVRLFHLSFLSHGITLFLVLSHSVTLF